VDMKLEVVVPDWYARYMVQERAGRPAQAPQGAGT
jgi:hypothetical protein